MRSTLALLLLALLSLLTPTYADAGCCGGKGLGLFNRRAAASYAPTYAPVYPAPVAYPVYPAPAYVYPAPAYPMPAYPASALYAPPRQADYPYTPYRPPFRPGAVSTQVAPGSCPLGGSCPLR